MRGKISTLVGALIIGALAGAALYAWDKYVGPKLASAGVPGATGPA